MPNKSRLIKDNAGQEALLSDLAYNSGTSFMNLNPATGAPNYICAQSYTTLSAAQTGLCSGSTWVTSAPGGITGSYYVAIRAFAVKKLFTPLSNYLPDVMSSTVIMVSPGGSIPSGVVMAFDLTGKCAGAGCVNNCPTGWSRYTLANGRNIIGTGSSGANGSTNHTFRQSQGEEEHTMTLNELVPHNHTAINGWNTKDADAGRSDTNAEIWSGGATGTTGGGAPFNVMDPYIALLYCIKN